MLSNSAAERRPGCVRVRQLPCARLFAAVADGELLAVIISNDAAVAIALAAKRHRDFRAQRQQQNVAKLKADAQKVVSIISGDEAKKQTYCEARDIAKQIVQAGHQKDNEKAEELADKLTEQQMNLGSEYLALMQSLRNANLTPKDGQEIESLFDELDESSCPH